MFGKKKKDVSVFAYQEWYTPFKCGKCTQSFGSRNELTNHELYLHLTSPFAPFNPTEKENTMNTYTITTEGLHQHKIMGTRHTVNPDGLWIQDGVKPVAFFKHYDHFTIERDTEVDLGYEAKIKELEALNNKRRAENTRLFQTLERNTTTITELRKQRNDYKMKLNSLYGRNAREVGACDKEYTAFFSGGVLGKSPCIYQYGHSGAHKTESGIVWVSPNV